MPLQDRDRLQRCRKPKFLPLKEDLLFLEKTGSLGPDDRFLACAIWLQPFPGAAKAPFSSRSFVVKWVR